MSDEVDEGVAPEALKDEIRDALGSRFPKVMAAIDSALDAKKTVSVSIECKFCKRSGRYPAVIADHRGALEASTWLVEHGFGRPGISPSDTAEDKIIFVRVIDGQDSARIYNAALEFIPEADKDDFHLRAAYVPSGAIA